MSQDSIRQMFEGIGFIIPYQGPLDQRPEGVILIEARACKWNWPYRVSMAIVEKLCNRSAP